jgi:hypothetical protein
MGFAHLAATMINLRVTQSSHGSQVSEDVWQFYVVVFASLRSITRGMAM